MFFRIIVGLDHFLSALNGKVGHIKALLPGLLRNEKSTTPNIFYRRSEPFILDIPHSAIDLLVAGVAFKNRGARKTEQLRFRKEALDSLVVVAKLGAMTFIENDNDAFVAQGREARPSFWMVVTITLSA